METIKDGLAAIGVFAVFLIVTHLVFSLEKPEPEKQAPAAVAVRLPADPSPYSKCRSIGTPRARCLKKAQR